MKNVRNLIIILVILAMAIWIDLPNNPGIHVAGINKEISTHLGLDLVGGVQVLLEADMPDGTAVTPDDMNIARRIVENRVNGLGVEEAVVQRVGDRRIVVEIPGVQDPEQAIAAVKQTGLLEFVDMSSISPQEAQTYQGRTIVTNFGQTEGSQTSVTGTITSTVPQEIWPTVMTGKILKNAFVQVGQLGEYSVAFELTSEGSQEFATFTAQHVGSVLAIVLDKQVISVPTINNAITGGTGEISGSFTEDEANTLAVQLRYGSLPIPLKVVETRTIGPTLGQDSLNKSLLAGAVGATVVILFMLLYYRLPGGLADISIIIYALIALAIFRYVPVTLTLPGIAGFLLSTGSALDANILIFERMKEELRDGRSLSAAINQGWLRAWPSIRDSNIAALLTSAILYWFGSVSGATIVKGFSLTLALGVVVSLFTAIVVTRTLLNLVLDYFKPTNLSRWFGI